MWVQRNGVFPTNFSLMAFMPSRVSDLKMHSMQVNGMLSITADPPEFCTSKCRVGIRSFRIEWTIVD
jgi:hypothetical protein